jgi:hypothetical protein
LPPRRLSFLGTFVTQVPPRQDKVDFPLLKEYKKRKKRKVFHASFFTVWTGLEIEQRGSSFSMGGQETFVELGEKIPSRRAFN